MANETPKVVRYWFIDTASADLGDELDDLVGYTIIDSKTVDVWYDDEEMEEGSLEGYDYDRVIMFRTLTMKPPRSKAGLFEI
jgi:hypothetical protein